GVAFMSGQGTAFNPETRTAEWSVESLAAGKTWDSALKVRAESVGEHPLQGLVESDRMVKARVTLPVEVVGAAGLTVDVAAKDYPLEMGAETVYEIRLVNQGSASCTHVTLSAMIPEGLSAIQAEGPAKNRIGKHQVTFDSLPQLASHAGVVYRVHVKGMKS